MYYNVFKQAAQNWMTKMGRSLGFRQICNLRHRRYIADLPWGGGLYEYSVEMLKRNTAGSANVVAATPRNHECKPSGPGAVRFMDASNLNVVNSSTATVVFLWGRYIVRP